eukprot:437215-Amphidinium_carterae.5
MTWEHRKKSQQHVEGKWRDHNAATEYYTPQCNNKTSKSGFLLHQVEVEDVCNGDFPSIKSGLQYPIKLLPPSEIAEQL